MGNLQVAPPENFTFSKPEEWTKWSKQFKNYRQASGLTERDETSQVRTIIYTMGDEAEDILILFRLTEEQKP